MSFTFRKHDNVGNAQAEEDSKYLDECFLDTGDLDQLLDCENSKRIIVGRTGAGKTALLYHIYTSNPHVIQLSPHDLSLNFIATNKVIAFFEEAGVNLSPFYVLLWKHLLVVELLRDKFHIQDDSSHRDFMRTIKSIIDKKNRNKELALEYLEQWGNKFWLTTEQRIHELTSKVESSLSSGVNAKFSGITLNASAAKELTETQKTEVREHGLDAVSKVQIRELDNMLTVLEDNIFNDDKNPYFISVDMLDEDWADDRIKFKLIRALIDVVKRFKALSNVKIILAIRSDLLQKSLYLETIAGFQEEKFKSLFLYLSWSKNDLKQLVEKRINKLIRHTYTKGDVTFKDVFPNSVDGKDTFDYLVERTFYRPRDIIIFINECLSLCTDRPAISASIIKEAEGIYSAERLQALANEWAIIYPNLIHTSKFFYGMKNHFDVSQITQSFIEEKYGEIIYEIKDANSDLITQSIDSLYMSKGNFDSVRNFILREFYMLGLIGIKSGPSDSVSWSRLNNNVRLSAGQIKPSSVIYIHPMFHRVLGIRVS